MFAVLHGFSEENNRPVMKANRTMDESEEVVSASKDLRFQDFRRVWFSPYGSPVTFESMILPVLKVGCGIYYSLSI